MNDRIHIFEFSHLLAWNFKLVPCLLVSKGSSLLEQQFNSKVALGPWKWTIFNRNKGEKYHMTWTHFFYRWRDFHSLSHVAKVFSPLWCFDLDSFLPDRLQRSRLWFLRSLRRQRPRLQLAQRRVRHRRRQRLRQGQRILPLLFGQVCDNQLGPTFFKLGTGLQPIV